MRRCFIKQITHQDRQKKVGSVLRKPLAFQGEKSRWHFLVFSQRHDVTVLHLEEKVCFYIEKIQNISPFYWHCPQLQSDRVWTGTQRRHRRQRPGNRYTISLNYSLLKNALSIPIVFASTNLKPHHYFEAQSAVQESLSVDSERSSLCNPSKFWAEFFQPSSYCCSSHSSDSQRFQTPGQ